jgi:hypothetical protein
MSIDVNNCVLELGDVGIYEMRRRLTLSESLPDVVSRLQSRKS